MEVEALKSRPTKSSTLDGNFDGNYWRVRNLLQ